MYFKVKKGSLDPKWMRIPCLNERKKKLFLNHVNACKGPKCVISMKGVIG